jgi:hypothetical protein
MSIDLSKEAGFNLIIKGDLCSHGMTCNTFRLTGFYLSLFPSALILALFILHVADCPLLEFMPSHARH